MTANNTQHGVAVEGYWLEVNAAEAATDDFYQADDEKLTLPVTIIKSGKSLNKSTNYYYPPAVIKQAVQAGRYAGSPVYINHPTELERRERVRDVSKLVGELTDDVRFHDATGAAHGRLQVFDDAMYKRLKRGARKYGLSHYAGVSYQSNTALEGAFVNLVTSIDEVRSVDIVSNAGAGGGMSVALEAAYAALTDEEKETTNMANTPAAQSGTAAEALAGAADTNINQVLASMMSMLSKINDTLQQLVNEEKKEDAAEAATQAATSTDLAARAAALEAEVSGYRKRDAVRSAAAAINGKRTARLSDAQVGFALEGIAVPDGVTEEQLAQQVSQRLDAFAALVPVVAAPVVPLPGSAQFTGQTWQPPRPTNMGDTTTGTAQEAASQQLPAPYNMTDVNASARLSLLGSLGVNQQK